MYVASDVSQHCCHAQQPRNPYCCLPGLITRPLLTSPAPCPPNTTLQSDKARPGSGASEKAELMPPAPQQESKWPRWVAAVAGALGGACAVLAIGFLFNFGAYLWKLALRAVVAKFSLPLPLPWGV